jgi:hypothetical protein
MIEFQLLGRHRSFERRQDERYRKEERASTSLATMRLQAGRFCPDEVYHDRTKLPSVRQPIID